MPQLVSVLFFSNPTYTCFFVIFPLLICILFFYIIKVLIFCWHLTAVVIFLCIFSMTWKCVQLHGFGCFCRTVMSSVERKQIKWIALTSNLMDFRITPALSIPNCNNTLTFMLGRWPCFSVTWVIMENGSVFYKGSLSSGDYMMGYLPGTPAKSS